MSERFGPALYRLDKLMDDAIAERHSLGLYVPDKPQIELSCNLGGSLAVLEDGKVKFNLFYLRPPDGLDPIDFENTYLSLCYCLNNPADALDFMLGRPIGNTDLKANRVQYLIELKKLTGEAVPKFTKFVEGLKSEKFDDDVLCSVRHELDHKAFFDGHLGRELDGLQHKLSARMKGYKSLSDFVRSIPDDELRKYLKLKILAETCAWFFDAVPFMEWDSFRKAPKKFIRQVGREVRLNYVEDPDMGADNPEYSKNNQYVYGAIEAARIENDWMRFPGIYEEKRTEAAAKYADAVGKAYAEEPPRLRKAYVEAPSLKSFLNIASGLLD